MGNEASRLDTIIKQVIRKTGLATRVDPEDAIQSLRTAVTMTLHKQRLRRATVQKDPLYTSPDQMPPELLWVILYRRALDMLRSPSISRSGVFEKPSEEQPSLSDKIACLGPESARTPEQIVIVREALRIIDAVLSPLEKEILIRLYCEEQTQVQAAKELGLSRSWLQVVHADALEKVRRKM